ncbi:serine hydrolase domain-containing protein [Psychromonas sp. Urea-02u-13]|uniref:serine hydrolase domain-containing protein n=1 Tax=Psychromonas sp. Urea-02u-13 TaxID=2058326 RepID=UPI0012FEEBD3|nr:serine hydrolase domain-containing protein [Psychromonas sp. Urea-02u-13]
MKFKKIVTSIYLCFCASTYADVFAIKESSKQREFNGVAIVTKGNDVLFKHSSNSLKNEKDTDLNENSQFIIGSLSKQITATLVLREVDKGNLKLDEPISTYLPQLKQKWSSVVTIRNLLNHTSGIVNINQPLQSKPNKEFAYSNLGYDLLGEIVSNTSRDSYSSSAMQLFQICEMNNSISVAENSLPPASLIGGFNEEENGEMKLVTSKSPYSSIPSGGLISTVSDLAKWNQCLHKGDILSAEIHQEMVSREKIRSHRWGDLGYGFGLQLSTDLDKPEWSHSGYVNGYISTMIYYPESDVSSCCS